jgi:hypothetical protein
VSPSFALTAWKISLEMEVTNKNVKDQQVLKNCRKWMEEKLAKTQSKCT